MSVDEEMDGIRDILLNQAAGEFTTSKHSSTISKHSTKTSKHSTITTNIHIHVHVIISQFCTSKLSSIPIHVHHYLA